MKNKPLKVYLCGSISNDNKYKMKFIRAENKLINLGYDVINPVTICYPNTNWEICMRICIAALATCDCIYIIDNIQNSEGAQLEKYIAEKLKIDFI
jgi:hypothetical protein